MGLFSRSKPSTPATNGRGWIGATHEGDPNCSHQHYSAAINDYGEWNTHCTDCGYMWNTPAR